MRNFYDSILSKSNKLYTFFGMLVLFTFISSAAFGQDMFWKGTVDTDASNPDNWEPAGDYFNKALGIDTADAVIWPVFTAAREDSVLDLAISNLAEITINKPAGTTFQLLKASQYFLKGTINVESGKLRNESRANFYFEDTLGVMNVSGNGIFEVPNLISMGNRSASAGLGGHIILSDSAVCETGDIIRFQDDSTKSTITILDDAKMIIHKDYRTDLQFRIDRGQIHSDEDNDVKIDFDAVSSTCTLTTRSKDALIAFPGEQQNAIASESSVMVWALENRGYTSLTDVEWKYTSTSGSNYQSFNPVVTGDTAYIVFPDPGTFYVVFSGMKDGNPMVSSEIPVVVAPNYVKLTLTDEQKLRPGQVGATISCIDNVTITSREWKVSTTQGSGYESFDPAVTGTDYTPSFDTAGVYYVVCEYVYDGNTYQTSEVTIKVNTDAFTIVWNGSVSDDAYDIRNWTPMAHVQWMTLDIPAESTVWPKLTGNSNDTINLFMNGKLIIEKTDTARVSFRKNGWYLNSEMIVNSGTVYLRQTRLDNGNAIITVNNDAQVILAESWFIMGNSSAPTNGGRVNLADDAVFYLQSADANAVWRWVTNNDSLSAVYITDNAVFKMTGNYFNNYSSLAETGDIFTDEGFEVVVNYNEVDDITSVYTRSASAFGLADYSDMVVGVGQPGTELSTINDENIYTYTWKYTTTPGSGYVPFDTLNTSSVFSPVFDAPGLYFVVCQGYDSIAYSTSDEVQVLAVEVLITPDSTQSIEPLQEGEVLTVTESTAADTREWKVSTTSGSGYEAIFPPVNGTTYTPLFVDKGVYYIVCESMVQGTAILSNEVMIEVGSTGVEDISKASFNVYPNPSNGRFFITVPDARDYTLTVVDIAGKTILTRNYTDSLGVEEISVNQTGIFIVKVQTEENTSARRIIVR